MLALTALLSADTLLPMTTSKWTPKDLPSQSGRTVVITGANSGIGLAAARALGRAGAHVVLGARRGARSGRREVDPGLDRGPAARPRRPQLGARVRRRVRRRP